MMANAWGPLLGAAVLAVVAYYFGYELKLPDTQQDYFAFGVAGLVAAWIVVFLWNLIGAPARLYARLEDENGALEVSLLALELQRANLTVSGPHLRNDLASLNKKHWRMTVHNAGPTTAHNVIVKLKNGGPEPTDPKWGDYPYPVFPVGTITNDPGQIRATEREINVNDDQSYEITCGWKSEGGQFFTDINTKGGGGNSIQINSDERWKLSYEVTAGNASSIKFDLEIFLEDDQVKVVRS